MTLGNEVWNIVCAIELSVALLLILRPRLRVWWFTRVAKKPRMLGFVDGDLYLRYEYFGAFPKPLDALTITLATHEGCVAWARDEREHQPLRMGVIVMEDNPYQAHYLHRAIELDEVVAIFQTREELAAWKSGFAWPRYTGARDEAQ